MLLPRRLLFSVHHNESLLFTFSLCHSLYNHGKPTLLAFPSIKQSNTRCSADSSSKYNAKDRKELISASVVKQRKESRFSWYDLGLQMAIVFRASTALCFSCNPSLGRSRKSQCRKNLYKACLPPCVLEKGAAAPQQWLCYLPCSQGLVVKLATLCQFLGRRSRSDGNSLPQSVFSPLCIFVLQTGKLNTARQISCLWRSQPAHVSVRARRTESPGVSPSGTFQTNCSLSLSPSTISTEISGS